MEACREADGVCDDVVEEPGRTAGEPCTFLYTAFCLF